MDQSDSTENSNDDLINTLINRQFIHSINVEKVFRCVDRGLYFTNDQKFNAYKHADWQSGDVHLSAPSTYATVLQLLDLRKGHKFLNIGSGIGYLSTLAGLLLGVNGVNHGIEIVGSLIEIANQKLEEFKQNSAAIDYFEFCEPVFMEGNACELLSMGYYDRVYCGAGVTTAESPLMINLIKIGGALIIPSENSLKKVIKVAEYAWITNDEINIPFPNLVESKQSSSSMKFAKFPTIEPLSLKTLCRSNIRASIRDCLYESHSGLQMHTKCTPNKSYDANMSYNQDRAVTFLEVYSSNENEQHGLQEFSNAFSDSDNSMSDQDSTSGSEGIEDENDVDERNTSEHERCQCSNCRCDSREDITSDTSQSDSEVAGELIKYRFLNERKENELSKLMKAKIDLLPLPTILKRFLNYSKD